MLRRGGVSAACARALAAFWLPCVFGVFLRVRALVLQSAWRGGVGSCLVCIPLSFGRHALVLTLAARVKSGNSGANSESRVFPIAYSGHAGSPMFPRLKTHLREPITENIGRLVVGSNQLCADEPFPTLVTRVGTLFPQILLGSISKENGSHLV